jgi:rod shape-determining protein MreC
MPKKWLLLSLFVILALSIMMYQSNRRYWLPFQFLNTALNRVHEMKISVKDAVTSPLHRMFLREEENIRLKAELSKLLQEQRSCRETILENRKLKDILSLREREYRYVTAARIIAKSTDQWSNTVIIDKGTADGVAKEMVGVTDRGLAGKISVTSRSFSHLLLLTDINFSVAARLQESRIEGIVSGTGFRKCHMKYVPAEEEVKKGAIVITSGLDSLFPPGIPIGYVSDVNKKNAGIFQDIEVLPFVDNIQLEIVAIIKKE